MRLTNVAGKALGALGRKVAPAQASGFVRAVLERAIDGFGPLPGAAKSAEKALAANNGDTEAAIRDLIDSHTKMAGAQGFATNIGGLVTAAATIPANIAGLALVQCHLVAAIAYLRGYDLHDPNVRNAVLACMLGKSSVRQLVGDRRLPATPLGIATAASHDPAVDEQIAQTITAELIAGVGGKRLATFVGKRIPLVGGAVGGATDGYGTWQIGRYAAKELKPHPPKQFISGG
ncbi:EcsC family protein [Nakamurella aerolata]|uniref:EcsC family protein n=1 Tax=Nakamurella aerolata TaxID=1656892 RepID=A0A849ADI1_9ACTN|nr:EcsC family protein [Nakamurella aerolata]